ncbi:Hypothetical protein A7982_01949 [Minicystis rosea]|nr:Hypothetical protein A7982_01949 [Minicystis rosea]
MNEREAPASPHPSARPLRPTPRGARAALVHPTCTARQTRDEAEVLELPAGRRHDASLVLVEA